jgi:hypothetical protein
MSDDPKHTPHPPTGSDNEEGKKEQSPSPVAVPGAGRGVIAR